MTEPTTYLIPATNFPRLQGEIEKLNKRAARLGCDPIVLTQAGTKTVTKRDELLQADYLVTYFVCTVDGAAPRLNGWTLVAILEPMEGGMLVREIPGQTCPPQYRTTNLRCDHCEAVRRRNNVYVLVNEAAENKQVGKSCLRDFLGGTSPESLLAGAEYLTDFAKLAAEAREEGWGFRTTWATPIHQYVTAAAVCVRRLGWVPRSAVDPDDYGPKAKEATADLAWRICTQPREKHTMEMVERHKLVAEPKDAELAEKVVAWAAGMDPDAVTSTYMHDLGLTCRQQCVTLKTIGFVASAINAYRRAVEAAAPSAAKPKLHLGSAGVRQEFTGLKVVMLNGYTSGGQFQRPMTFVKFTDPSGNELIWRASGRPEWLEIDETFDVRATVKEHTTYNGAPQTVISRVDLCEAKTA
jgi:ribosomal protein L36